MSKLDINRIRDLARIEALLSLKETRRDLAGKIALAVDEDGKRLLMKEYEEVDKRIKELEEKMKSECE